MNVLSLCWLGILLNFSISNLTSYLVFVQILLIIYLANLTSYLNFRPNLTSYLSGICTLLNFRPCSIPAPFPDSGPGRGPYLKGFARACPVYPANAHTERGKYHCLTYNVQAPHCPCELRRCFSTGMYISGMYISQFCEE